MNVKPYHVFSMEGQYYLVKLLSNRVYKISQDEGFALRCFRNENNEISLSLLDKYGLLTSNDDFEQGRFARWQKLFAERKLYGIELMMAQECNLRCEYCYGDANFGGSGKMSWETAKQAMDWLIKTIDDKKYPPGSKILISFIGGEPLLNFPVIKKTVKYVHDECKRRDILFSITTNLTLLTDEMLDFIKMYPMGLCISFDGRMQHRYRPFANGKDSYEKVTSNIKKVLAVMPDASGRATLYGDGDMDEMADDLREIGFSRGYINAASGSLISGTVIQSKRDSYKFLSQSYEELSCRYVKAIKERDEKTYRRISFDSEFMQSVGLGWNPPVQMMSCGCARTMCVVDVDGNIYPCHRFVGVPEMKMGDLSTPFEELAVGDFAKHVTFVNPKCKDCFLRFSCGGSCMHENYCDASILQGEASVHIPFDEFCEYRRIAAELAIHVEHSLNAEDKAWLRMLEHGKKEGVNT